MNRLLRRIDPRRWVLARRMRENDIESEGIERLNRYIAVQHYISDNRKQLRERLNLLGSNVRRSGCEFDKARFLPAVLQANLSYYEEEYEQAAGAYRASIDRAMREYHRALSKPHMVRERRKVEFLSVVISLLYMNLADALSQQQQDSPEVLDLYARALEFQPSFVMLREVLAEHHAKNRRWDQAAASYEDAYASQPTTENHKRLLGNLAALRRKQAMYLMEVDDVDEAESVLKSSLKALSDAQLEGWMAYTHYSLGVIWEQAKKLDDAAEAYRQGASLYLEEGDRASASYLAELQADIACRTGDLPGAIEILENSVTTATGIESDTDRTRLARLKGKLATMMLVLGESKQAMEMLAESRALWRQHGWSSPTERILSESDSLLDGEKALSRVKMLLQAQLQSSPDADCGRDLIYAQRVCHRRTMNLAEWPALTSTGQDDTSLLPVVRPLVLELDSTLVSDANVDLIIDSLAPAMRERIAARYGIKAPGVILREYDAGYRQGSYVMMIHEIPLRTGQLVADHRLFVGPREELDALKIEGTEHDRRFQDETAFWIHERDWERMLSNGLALYEPLEVPLLDLEDLIAQNLVEIVGHQEVQNLLDTNGLMGTSASDIAAKETFKHMDPLTSVIRALLAERVSITNFPHIYERFRDYWNEGLAPWRITELLRLDPDIRPTLWGNSNRYSHFILGDRLMNVIEQGVQDDDAEILALEPESIQDILSALRDAVTGHDSAAVVVPRRRVRAQVRSLFELEFPQLPVLAMAELEPGLGALASGVVDLPDPSSEEPA